MPTKVRTFGMELRPMKAMQELQKLDEEVNAFLAATGAKRILSVSDCATTDNTGETIGIIRVVAYES